MRDFLKKQSLPTNQALEPKSKALSLETDTGRFSNVDTELDEANPKMQSTTTSAAQEESSLQSFGEDRPIICDHVETHEPILPAITHGVTSKRGRSMFVSSSPEKSASRSEELDEMPLAKRCKMSTNRATTLEDLEEEWTPTQIITKNLNGDPDLSISHHVSNVTSMAHYPNVDDEYVSAKRGSAFDEPDLEFFFDEIPDDDHLANETGSDEELRSFRGTVQEKQLEPRLDALSLPMDSPSHLQIQLSSTPAPGIHRNVNQVSEQGITSGAAPGQSELHHAHAETDTPLIADSGSRVCSKVDLPSPVDHVPEEVSDDDEDPTAWVLREFGQYVDVV